MDDATRATLNREKTECGCRAGAVALLLSASGYLIYSLWIDPLIRTHRERVVTGICIALAGALIGKMVGIQWARSKDRSQIRTPGNSLSVAFARNAEPNWRK